MIEAAVALGIAGLLAAGVLAYTVIPVDLALAAGAWATLSGLVTGLPAGLYYHLRLRRGLLAQGPLPGRWWWRPTEHHARLDPTERRRVLRWFRAGAAGFLLTLVGCALTAIGAVRGR